MVSTLNSATRRKLGTVSGLHITATTSTPAGKRLAAVRQWVRVVADQDTRKATEMPATASAAALASSLTGGAAAERSTPLRSSSSRLRVRVLSGRRAGIRRRLETGGTPLATTETVRASRIALTPRLPATLTAISNSSSPA